MKKLLVSILIICVPSILWSQSNDWRLITNGQRIYEDGYCDQPYVVTTSDGTWVCTFTTAPEHEGAQIQYIASTYSSDQGASWSEPVEIEPAAQEIEASWAMPLITEFDRIYVFYTFNGDTIRHLPDGTKMRADTHGWYCYRYSDNNGKTWSERYRLNMPVTSADLSNDFSGKVQMFWGIGKPVSKDKDTWFSFTKLGKYFLRQSEGWIYHSDNILTERNVSQVNWQLLPNGDVGIRSPELGSVQEEFIVQPMNMEGGLYCIYRTTLGQPAECYSIDNGKTWSEPTLINYASGLPLRNPRACPRIWKCKNGKYLLWHHNNGGQGFEYRNPAWVSGGIEIDGKIIWSQPEILIYGPDRSYETGRFSYPDLIEEDGKYWITTTQKTTATVHEVPASFFEMLWGQFDQALVTADGLIGSFSNFTGTKALKFDEPLQMNNGGFAMDFWITIDAFENAVIFEGDDINEKNIELSLRRNGTLAYTMINENDTLQLTSDMARLQKGKKHHVAILTDAEAQICYMLIDGSICDGGGEEVFGFRWFDEKLKGINVQKLSISKFPGKIDNLRVYGKQMWSSYFVSNYNAEKLD